MPVFTADWQARIHVRNLTVISPVAAGVCVGSEMSGGVIDVLVENVVAINCSTGFRCVSMCGCGVGVG